VDARDKPGHDDLQHPIAGVLQFAGQSLTTPRNAE